MATQTLKPAHAGDAKSGAALAADAQDWPDRIFQKLREFGVRHVT